MSGLPLRSTGRAVWLLLRSRRAGAVQGVLESVCILKLSLGLAGSLVQPGAN